MLVALFVIATSSTASAQSNDSIFSRHIREADNNTAQDTNSGYGIKTGHLQDGAVTSVKLAPAAVTNTKLAPGSVGNSTIMDGSVTDSKISGTISGAKIGTHAHTTAEVSGLDAALSGKANRSSNVVIVAKSGGDFQDPIAAVDAISGATAENPFVVKIMPGVYTLTRPLYLKPHVDIEGSGRKVTILTGVLDGQCGGMASFGLVNGTTSAEIRSVTIKTSSPGECAVGVYVPMTDFDLSGVFSFSLEDVDVFASSAAGYATAVHADGASIKVRRSGLHAGPAAQSAIGVVVNGAYIDLKDSEVTVQNDGANGMGIILSGLNNLFYDRTLNSRIESVRVSVKGSSMPWQVGAQVESYSLHNGPFAVLKDTNISLSGGAASYAVIAQDSTVRCLGVTDSSYNAIVTAFSGSLTSIPCN